MLRNSAQWLPKDQPLLVVSPHPDDEVLAAGGLMHQHAKRGGRVSVLSVTDGEAAYSDWAGLDAIRRLELHEALGHLGDGRIEVCHLSIPDGHVGDHRARLFSRMSAMITQSLTLVSPYERDGHPDHDVTGVVCRAVAELRGVVLVRYPVWAWHHRTPREFDGQLWGRYEFDAETYRAKARAVASFRSQLEPRGSEPIVPRHVLDYFKRGYEPFLL